MKDKKELAELYVLKTDGDAWELDAFIAGFLAKEKIIRDKINNLKSQLKQETQPKLTKYYNTELIEKLKNQIEILNKIV